MKEQLITFETAKLAKEKGFILHTMFYYNSDNPLSNNIELKRRGWNSFEAVGMEYSNTDEESGLLTYLLDPINNAPTQSLLKDWLREIHKFHVVMDRVILGKEDRLFFKREGYNENDLCSRAMTFDTEGDLKLRIPGEIHKDYGKALEKGLQDALKLIEL